MNTRKFLFRLLIVSTVWLPAVQAESTLEFRMQESGDASGTTQPVMIKNGMLLVKGAGGDKHLDLLYSRSQQRLSIIDHRRKTIMPVDEQQVKKISRQTEDFMPLLQGLGAQAAKLKPEQRAKWEEMLGGKVSLDRLADAAKPPKPTSFVKTGIDKQVAGVQCEEMSVVQGKKTMAEVCVAPPEKLNLTKDDYATIRSLFDFSGNLAAKTHGFAEHFGIKIPRLNVKEIGGVPVEMRDLSGSRQGSLTLNRIVTSSVSDDLMQEPTGYKTESLSLWK